MSLPKILVIILSILVISAGIYLVRNDNSGQKNTTMTTPLPSIKPAVNKDLNQEGRDNQRMSDLSAISKALDEYAIANGQYPKTNGIEKISDEDSATFNILKSNGYLDQIYSDPSQGKYYGYKSDGKVYELTAVLENKNDNRCTLSGNLCIYKIKKGEISLNTKQSKNSNQPVTMKNCEFPEKIGDNVKEQGGSKPVVSSEAEENGQKGLVSDMEAIYSDNILISFMKFNTEFDAENYMKSLGKFSFMLKECNIAGINGICSFNYLPVENGGKYSYDLYQGEIFWREDKTVKSTSASRKKSETPDLENKVKKEINLFVSTFKNCEVE